MNFYIYIYHHQGKHIDFVYDKLQILGTLSDYPRSAHQKSLQYVIQQPLTSVCVFTFQHFIFEYLSTKYC